MQVSVNTDTAFVHYSTQEKNHLQNLLSFKQKFKHVGFVPQFFCLSLQLSPQTYTAQGVMPWSALSTFPLVKEITENTEEREKEGKKIDYYPGKIMTVHGKDWHKRAKKGSFLRS